MNNILCDIYIIHEMYMKLHGWHDTGGSDVRKLIELIVANIITSELLINDIELGYFASWTTRFIIHKRYFIGNTRSYCVVSNSTESEFN